MTTKRRGKITDAKHKNVPGADIFTKISKRGATRKIPSLFVYNSYFVPFCVPKCGFFRLSKRQGQQKHDMYFVKIDKNKGLDKRLIRAL